jgi:hypothetical protein
MFGVNWSDPQTYWLNITNFGLGLVVLICIAAVAVGVVQELYARRKVHSMDREVRDLVASYGDGHAFHVPDLGLTMADGGEPLPDARPKQDGEKPR